MIGLGTLLNITTIVVGATIGILIGKRLPGRTSRVVTDALGLVTLVLGGLNLVSLTDVEFVSVVGAGGTFLVVIGALLIGSIIGSLAGIEFQLERFGGWLQNTMTRPDHASGSDSEVGTGVASSLSDAPLPITGRQRQKTTALFSALRRVVSRSVGPNLWAGCGGQVRGSRGSDHRHLFFR